MPQHTQHIVDPRERDLRVVELPGQRLHLLARAEVPPYQPVRLRPIGNAGRIGGEAGVRRQLRPAQHLVAEHGPSPSFWTEMRMGLPSRVWNTP